jgi:hypothetical protein
MSKTASTLIGLGLFGLIAIGLFDLFRGANLLTGSIAIMFVAVGAFNSWCALKKEADQRCGRFTGTLFARPTLLQANRVATAQGLGARDSIVTGPAKRPVAQRFRITDY